MVGCRGVWWACTDGGWSLVVRCMIINTFLSCFSVTGRMHHYISRPLVWFFFAPNHHANRIARDHRVPHTPSRGWLVYDDFNTNRDSFSHLACCLRTTHRENQKRYRIVSRRPKIKHGSPDNTEKNKCRSVRYRLTRKPNTVSRNLTTEYCISNK